MDKFPANTKVFIVEDDAFISSLLVKKISAAGATVETVNNGEAAFAAIKKFQPNVILMDIMLPGIDGLQVLQQVKADADLRAIPVIMLSNLGEKEQIDQAKKTGAVNFLIKATMSVDEIAQEALKALQK
jgi:CheY-like chemotaxis protein